MADISITGVEKVSDTVEILTTSIPGVAVRVITLDDSQVRQIRNRTGKLVSGTGVDITRSSEGVKISWPSGEASTLEAMERKIEIMQLALWMATEMELEIG